MIELNEPLTNARLDPATVMVMCHRLTSVSAGQARTFGSTPL